VLTSADVAPGTLLKTDNGLRFTVSVVRNGRAWSASGRSAKLEDLRLVVRKEHAHGL
jgi:hypothetical protein